MEFRWTVSRPAKVVEFLSKVIAKSWNFEIKLHKIFQLEMSNKVLDTLHKMFIKDMGHDFTFFCDFGLAKNKIWSWNDGLCFWKRQEKVMDLCKPRTLQTLPSFPS